MDSYSIIKSFCKKIYLAGSGNFWFEEESIGDDSGFLYKMYGVILFLVYGSTTVLEIMAALIGDFPDDEKSDSVSLAVSHTVVMLKMFTVISNKQKIRELNRKMVVVCEEYQEKKLRETNYKMIKINVIAYVTTCYGSMVCFVFVGLRKLFQGSHFVTVVTYYPAFENDSALATFFRVYFTIVLFFIILSMILVVDGFSMMNMIMLKYKFITLRNYFDGLKEEFDKASKRNVDLAAENLTNGLIKGVVMHRELLNIAKDIDSIFGFVMALQICQTFGSCVSLLLQIALADDMTFVESMKIIFFFFALFFLLGLFLCNAGEITYQASLVSNSIFYCGWYECPVQRLPRRAIRPLVLFATTRAQQPLVMKAFKMLPLTYESFILVVRSTYSVFALLYAQNQ